MPKPFPQSYWVIDGLFCAGHYPGSLDPQEANLKLNGLLDCGIRRVINLIPDYETGGGAPFVLYWPGLQALATQRGVQIERLRMGYPDGTAPTRDHMSAILNLIDASLAAAEPLYLHCWGGHGRTSTTVACYLIRHGATPQTAINQILAWRSPLPHNHFPFENKQASFVRSWRPGE